MSEPQHEPETVTIKAPVAMLWNLALARVASGTPSLEQALLWAATEIVRCGADPLLFGPTGRDPGIDDIEIEFDEDGIVGQHGAGMCQITKTL